MSITAGEFDHTRLLQQRHFADQLLLDGRIKQQFIPKINVFNYIQSLQTAEVNKAFNTRAKKDFDVEIMWMNTCSDLTIDDASCVRGGNQASTNAKTYALENTITKGFTVYDEQFRDNEYDADMAIAKLLLQADKQISEDFSQYLVGQLALFSGVNQVTNGKGVINPVDDTITDIDPSDWTAEIMAYFARVMQLNRFSNAALITGSNLFETIYVARANNANSEGKGDYILWNDMPIWFDLFNVDAVTDPDLYTFMVEQGSIALANKAFNPTMAKYLDHWAYTMPSKFMPGMVYDVWYDNACNESESARYNDMVVHNWKIKLRADLFLNPYGCDAEEDGDGVQTGGENSGVLRFRNEVPTLPTATPTP